MPQLRYAANLSSTEFPFLSYKKTRTVIVPGQDQQYLAGVIATGIAERQDFVPDLFYGHNILPTKQGWQSVGYRQVNTTNITLAFGEWILDIIEITPIFGANPILFAITTSGNWWLCIGTGFDAQRYGQYLWFQGLSSIAGFISIPFDPTQWGNGLILSQAFINGIQYLFVNGDTGYRCYSIGPDLILTPQALTGINIQDFIGITEANGYLIIYGNGSGADGYLPSVLWSSLESPTDFTPSLITGAGGGVVQQVQGAIAFCSPINGGFILYGTQNAVGATYSGNSYYPFNFAELVDSGGVYYRACIATSQDGENHYLYGTKGIQQLSLNTCQTVYPAALDFLGKVIIEDFAEGIQLFTEAQVTGKMDVALTVLGGRYLIFSYGFNRFGQLNAPRTFNYALCLDLVTNRWGKFKLIHSFIHNLLPFQGNVPFTPVDWTVNAAKNSMVFIDATSAINVVITDLQIATTGGVAIFGKYQAVRSNLLQLEYVQVENIDQGDAFAVYDLYSLDGKNTVYPPPQLAGVYNNGLLQGFSGVNAATGVPIVGINHSLCCIGKFDLSFLQLTLTQHGRR